MLYAYDRHKLDEETNGLVAEAYLRLNRSLDDLKPETVRQFFGLAALQMRRHLLDKLRAIHGRGELKRPKITSLTPDSPDGLAFQVGIVDAANAFDGQPSMYWNRSTNSMNASENVWYCSTGTDSRTKRSPT